MSNFPSCPELVAEIHRAFADTAERRIKIVVPEVLYSDAKAIDVQAAFTNKTWPEITVEFLLQHEGYRSFLSQEALYLFLPALMLESLKSDGIYAIAPALMRTFSPRPDGQMMEGEDMPLNHDQCCALTNYVEFLANEFADVFEDSLHSRNTLEYWKRHCGK